MNRLDRPRQVADAVLYEGYLLYPYRATSSKNQARWQFGVVGPRGAAARGLGEESFVEMQSLLRVEETSDAHVDIHLRFLQHQRRRTERREDDGAFTDVPEVSVGSTRWLAWDEAVEVEQRVRAGLDELESGVGQAVDIHPTQEDEDLRDDSGDVVAAVGIAGPLMRLSKKSIAAFLPHVIATADLVSVRLGYRGRAAG